MVDNGTLVVYYEGSELKVGDAVAEMGTYPTHRTVQVYQLERNWQEDDPSAYVSASLANSVLKSEDQIFMLEFLPCMFLNQHSPEFCLLQDGWAADLKSGNIDHRMDRIGKSFTVDESTEPYFQYIEATKDEISG